MKYDYKIFGNFIKLKTTKRPQSGPSMLDNYSA